MPPLSFPPFFFPPFFLGGISHTTPCCCSLVARQRHVGVDPPSQSKKMKETFFFSFCICSLAAFSLTLWLMQTGRGDSISPSRWLVSVVLSALVASYGVWRKSLDFAAGPVAFLVGYILTLADSSFCASMIAFFLASSRLTKWRKGEKEKFEAKENGGENHDLSKNFHFL